MTTPDPPPAVQHDRDGVTYYPLAQILPGVPLVLHAAAVAGMGERLEAVGYRAVFLEEYGLGVVWAYRDEDLDPQDEADD